MVPEERGIRTKCFNLFIVKHSSEIFLVPKIYSPECIGYA